MSPRHRAPIRVGVAGWLYDDWKGIVYPAPAPRGFDPLGFMARWVDAVEVESSFYGPLAARTRLRLIHPPTSAYI